MNMNNMLIQRAEMNAEGFLAAANCLCDEMEKDGNKLGIYGPAYTANLAFACELYLKQILILEHNEKHGHKLKKLYENLSEVTKQKIENEYNRRCKLYNLEVNKHVKLRELSDCLEAYNNAFEDWRYWFEGNKKSKYLGWIDFHILVEVLKNVVT